MILEGKVTLLCPVERTAESRS